MTIIVNGCLVTGVVPSVVDGGGLPVAQPNGCAEDSWNDWSILPQKLPVAQCYSATDVNSGWLWLWLWL